MKMLLVCICFLIFDADPGLAGSQARTILNFAYGGTYFIEPTAPGIPAALQMALPEITSTIHGFEQGYQIEAYPNPANDQITFTFNLPDIENVKAEIYITDLIGNKIAVLPIGSGSTGMLWSTDNVKNGIYQYSLYLNDQLVSSKRIVILR